MHLYPFLFALLPPTLLLLSFPLVFNPLRAAIPVIYLIHIPIETLHVVSTCDCIVLPDRMLHIDPRRPRPFLLSYAWDITQVRPQNVVPRNYSKAPSQDVAHRPLANVAVQISPAEAIMRKNLETFENHFFVWVCLSQHNAVMPNDMQVC